MSDKTADDWMRHHRQWNDMCYMIHASQTDVENYGDRRVAEAEQHPRHVGTKHTHEADHSDPLFRRCLRCGKDLLDDAHMPEGGEG